MDTKLTLKLNQQIIEKAKQYAVDKKLSLSRIIENYLNSLTSASSAGNEIEVSPFVKSISSKINISNDYDYKTEHTNFLEKKHK